ncbi:alpha/beta hydrolase [Niallia nealsonii]|uniref:Esterase n=1 Tax=Niallia nealsonii TaxID=115979 RepID=A0A2N0Z1G2_9BACI|nr:alpha/beta hydrolase-fold protein [Niallia nealsonii]PKG23348.1 esterase [Niallia nealsonii]
MNSPMIYELCKPSQIEPNKTYPAIFVLHGMGSNEQNMLSLVEGLEETFYIFSVRGPLSQPPGFAYFSIQGYGKPHREVFDHAINQLTSFIDYTAEQYPLDLDHLYLLGFSQGAIASMTLGLTLGSRMKGIVALSGYIPGFVKEEYMIKTVDQLSLFISHGEFDNVLPYEWGVESKVFFQGLGAKVIFEAYPEGHTVSLKNRQDFKKWILADLKE